MNKNIDELENEMNQLGRPIAVDAGVRMHEHIYVVTLVQVFLQLNCFHCFPNIQAQLYTILELCRAFDRVFKEHLDGGY